MNIIRYLSPNVARLAAIRNESSIVAAVSTGHGFMCIVEGRSIDHKAPRDSSPAVLARSMFAAARSVPSIAIAAFALSAAFIAVMAILIALGTRALQDGRAWIQHTDNVLLTAAQLREDLYSASNNRMRYIVLGDGRYAQNYRSSLIRINADLIQLSQLVSDNPAQVARVARLKALIDTRLGVALKKTFELSPNVLLNAMREPAARHTYDQDIQTLLSIFGSLRSTEQHLLVQRQATLDSEEFTFFWLEAACIVLALAGTAAGVYLTLRERVRARARELQLQTMHMQRLGIMNQMSSAMAHELTQPLTAARNYANALIAFASKPVPAADTLIDLARKIEKTILRTTTTLQRLRNFIEAADELRRPEEAGDLVDDAGELLKSMSTGVAIHCSVPPDLPLILVDRVQIQQVLVNIMRNAIEAMANTPAKELHVSVKMRSPELIEFCLVDTGPGITCDEESLFAPFVSSKQGGMGVGLSISRSIVRAHGGDLWASSPKTGGAAFHFTVPVAQTKTEELGQDAAHA